MPPIVIVAFIAVALTIWFAMEQHIVEFKCRYCGAYKGHDIHCPYHILDEE